MNHHSRYSSQRFLLLLACLAAGFPGCKQGARQQRQAVPSETGEALKKGVVLVDFREQQKVDVYIDGDIFTSYIYPADMVKPTLFPVRTAQGTLVTRGWPREPRAGEPVDHPHHVGCWLNYGDVNGYDFWGNSPGVPAERKASKGRVLHRGVKRAESRDALGVLEIAADWQIPDGAGDWFTVLQEQTVYEFSGDAQTRTIDRYTQLTAQEETVTFNDTKEGMFAIRLDRAFNFPQERERRYTDANGREMEEATVQTEGMNGQYLNSEGVSGKEVWGKRATWCCLSSNIGEEPISITIFDHPENINHPSYWHARDYGLFSINNLGARGYDENAEEMKTVLQPGESIVLKHRVYIESGTHSGADRLDAIFRNFASK